MMMAYNDVDVDVDVDGVRVSFFVKETVSYRNTNGVGRVVKTEAERGVTIEVPRRSGPPNDDTDKISDT